MTMRQNLPIGLISMKILLLEDELMLNNAICEYLVNIGHFVHPFSDGKSAFEGVDESFDLLLLDINTPTLDGFKVLDGLNQKSLYIPTIFISASVDMEDIYKAYDLGCVEYMKKPFHLEELGIKINQILKKSQSNTSHMRLSKNYSYSKQTQTLFFKNEPQELTKKQLDIIHLLALNINMVVDFERFRYDVWNGDNIDTPTIRAEMARLKKILKEDFVKNIRGLGYKVDRYYAK